MTRLGTPERAGEKRRVTIRDVARHAGVSIAAVSRALNRPFPETQLSEATHKQILSTAKSLGYRPHWSARALACGKTGNVGLLYVGQQYNGHNPLLRPVFSEMMTALSDTLRTQHYRLMLVPVSDEEQDWRNVLEEHQVDGCVVSHGLTPALVEGLSQRRIPTVLMNLDAELPVPRIVVDAVAGGHEATEHLLALGHRRLAFLYTPRGNPRRPNVNERCQGFKNAMRARGLEDKAIDMDSEAAQLVDAVVADRNFVTGVVCYSHSEAIELYHACWRRGLRIPDDLSVVAFNDIFPASIMTPPLTVVALPFGEMGRLAAESLIRQMAGGEVGEGSHTVLPQRLVVRESTAAPHA